jgi:hypothetical protein
VRYESATGTLHPIPQITLTALDGYNIATSGLPTLTTLATNPERLAIPIAQFP